MNEIEINTFIDRKRVENIKLSLLCESKQIDKLKHNKQCKQVYIWNKFIYVQMIIKLRSISLAFEIIQH